MLLDKLVQVKVLQKNTPGANKETYVPYSGFLFNGSRSPFVRMNIQPASPQFTALAEGQLFKTFRAFTAASGVTEGMRVTVSGTSDTYSVYGRERFDYGVGRHYELTLIRETV